MSKTEEALPPLPEPYMRESIATASNTRSVRYGYEQGGYARWHDMFTADQMRDYARAALAQQPSKLKIAEFDFPHPLHHRLPSAASRHSR